MRLALLLLLACAVRADDFLSCENSAYRADYPNNTFCAKLRDFSETTARNKARAEAARRDLEVALLQLARSWEMSQPAFDEIAASNAAMRSAAFAAPRPARDGAKGTSEETARLQIVVRVIDMAAKGVSGVLDALTFVVNLFYVPLEQSGLARIAAKISTVVRNLWRLLADVVLVCLWVATFGMRFVIWLVDNLLTLVLSGVYDWLIAPFPCTATVLVVFALVTRCRV